MSWTIKNKSAFSNVGTFAEMNALPCGTRTVGTPVPCEVGTLVVLGASVVVGGVAESVGIPSQLQIENIIQLM